MEENELFGEAHEQEENGLFGRMHEAEQLNLCGVVDGLNTDSLKYIDMDKVYEIQEFTKHFPMYDRVPQYFRDNPKIGRNEPCSCGSNKKYKKCCMQYFNYLQLLQIRLVAFNNNLNN